MKRQLSTWIGIILLFTGGLRGLSPAAAETSPPTIDVILWFDTEDYILPADDDACKRLAQLLTERNIHATFKVVGEKARVLEKRGRQDVIEALKKHTIAYHANFHSVHPTPSEYLANCGWLDGVEEFIRREGRGAADVKRIFGVPTLACYGQPGSSWASQAIGALSRIGVTVDGTPCYVDEGSHVGLNHAPFWYGGALNVYDIGPNCTRMELHSSDALAPAKEQFNEIAARLRRETAGGLISIYYHPCEWVHREFWDGVNFRRGANPPREQWKLPPQRTTVETDAAFQRFAAYMDWMRVQPGIHFITAANLPTVYPDLARSQGITEAELVRLAKAIVAGENSGIDFQLLGNKAFSLADQFELLNRAVLGLVQSQPMAYPLVPAGVLGPDSAPPATAASAPVCSDAAFRMTALDVADYLRTEHRVPARVFIGAYPIAPVTWMVGLAQEFLARREGASAASAKGIDLSHQPKLLPEKHVAQDTPDLFGGWVIHPAGFRAPKILEVARLQAWTLKPAIRAGSSDPVQ